MESNEIIIKLNELKGTMDQELFEELVKCAKQKSEIEKLIQKLGTMHPILTYREQAIYNNLKEIMEV
jgi:hypothetical protein